MADGKVDALIGHRATPISSQLKVLSKRITIRVTCRGTGQDSIVNHNNGLARSAYGFGEQESRTMPAASVRKSSTLHTMRWHVGYFARLKLYK